MDRTEDGSGRQVRALVLGATGMLGHKLVQRMASHGIAVTGTIRSSHVPDSAAARRAFLGAQAILTDVDVLHDVALEHALQAAQPHVVINAVGITKLADLQKDEVAGIATNALLPHRLARLCRARGIRLIHISTDCVFGDRTGPHAEHAATCAGDVYGRSKLLGEVSGTNTLTIRSSIIGRELRAFTSLVEWFLSQRGGKVAGYSGAFYTGLTTNAMCDVINKLVLEHPGLEGIWHVASDPISKFDILQMLNSLYNLDVVLEKHESTSQDRRLDGSKFAAATQISIPSWKAMLAEIRSDPTPYGAD